MLGELAAASQGEAGTEISVLETCLHAAVVSYMSRATLRVPERRASFLLAALAARSYTRRRMSPQTAHSRNVRSSKVPSCLSGGIRSGCVLPRFHVLSTAPRPWTHSLNHSLTTRSLAHPSLPLLPTACRREVRAAQMTRIPIRRTFAAAAAAAAGCGAGQPLWRMPIWQSRYFFTVRSTEHWAIVTLLSSTWDIDLARCWI